MTGLDRNQRDALHAFALEARQMLLEEIGSLLEGDYGLHPDGTLESQERLPNLAQDPYMAETYRRLEAYLVAERAKEHRPAEAVSQLIKETAFTWLNRLVAFKILETRGLLRETVGRGLDSSGFKFYLAENDHAYALYQQGQRDQAYRAFLLWQCGQVAQELNVLFDPNSLPSRLMPRPRALRDLLALLNAPDLAPAWQAEEAVGWVYQYFSEEEREVWGQRKDKVPKEIIPVKTQLFTPEWVIRFLVHNTLGRLWLQMHPDSRLRERLDYFVPPVEPLPPRPVKPVQDITLLDPACGTMHFGLTAFDLFHAMYQEEMERVGEPGWPERPSVEREEDIPAAILAHNLHGIDIDLRAVQLAALALYLKAKSYNPAAEIRQTNLAVAGVRPLDGPRLQLFLSRFEQDRPLLERVLTALWRRLEDAEWLGSLLRVEKTLRELIAVEQRHFLPLFAGLTGEYEQEAVEEEYWALLEAKVLQALDEFVRQTAADDPTQTFFAAEAVRGLRLAHLLLDRYDVVVTNPPYLDSRAYHPELKNLIESGYPLSKRNLYAAFIERCLELAQDNGSVGMLAGQSFMFISSFSRFREHLMNTCVVETLAQFDYGLFADARMDTTAFVLRREPDTSRREAHRGVYFRLVHAPDGESKRQAFEEALAAWRQQEEAARP